MLMSKKRRKHWAQTTDAKLHGKRRKAGTPVDPTHKTAHTAACEFASAEEVVEYRRAKAQPNVQQTAQERRDAYVERFIYPWAYGVCLRVKSIRNTTFPDKVDLLTARAEADPYFEDEQNRLLAEDEIELPEDPHEHYRMALSEWGRARHLRKIFRLTGTYPMDTGDMTTGEVYEWYLSLHDAVASYEEAGGA